MQSLALICTSGQDDEPRKIWVMSRILEYARFDDVWRYITPPDLRQYFQRLHLRPQVREVWAHAIEVWNRHGRQ